MANIISWAGVMKVSLAMPGVKVDRDTFLISTFRPYGVEEKELIEGRPSDFVSRDILDKVARGIINNHTTKVTALSTAAGIPGGFAMFGTIPTDVAQYYWHYLVMAQKLAYVYGWPDLRDENNAFSEEAQNLMTIFVGLGFGLQSANKAIREIAKEAAIHWAKRLPRMALTKTAWYPIAKKIAAWITGKQLTKNSMGKIASKIIPLLGGPISGIMTYATFKPMANRLLRELSSVSILSDYK